MGKLKIIQVNIFKGKYLGSLVPFLKQEDPDIITMEEVSAGGLNLCTSKSNLFELLKSELGLNGVYNPHREIIGHPDFLEGNAVFSKFPIVDTNIVELVKFRPMTLEEFKNPDFFPLFSRNLLDATLDLGALEIHTVAIHGAWTAPPTDTSTTVGQARKIADYLKGLDKPFVMGGDLNSTPNKEVVKIISAAANNLMTGSGARYTTHPKIHKIAPKALLVDYVFTSNEFERVSVEVPEIIVSDHLPVIAEISLE